MEERVSMDEIEAEDATRSRTRKCMSLLDVNANVDLGLDLAAPVDLAVAANLNVAAPIEAAASANVLSPGAAGGRLAAAARLDRPGHQRHRGRDGAAARRRQPDLGGRDPRRRHGTEAGTGTGTATGTAGAEVTTASPADATPADAADPADPGRRRPARRRGRRHDGGAGAARSTARSTGRRCDGGAVDGATGAVGRSTARPARSAVRSTAPPARSAARSTVPPARSAARRWRDVGSATPSAARPAASARCSNGGSLLDANVNIHANANLAAPIDGAVAANANVAAPIDAAVAANIGSRHAAPRRSRRRRSTSPSTWTTSTADATADAGRQRHQQ